MSTMREEVYHRLHPILEDLVDLTCDQIENLEDEYEDLNITRVIDILDMFKSQHPDQKIIVETSNRSVDLEIGEALIYEGNNGELVIDAE